MPIKHFNFKFDSSRCTAKVLVQRKRSHKLRCKGTAVFFFCLWNVILLNSMTRIYSTHFSIFTQNPHKGIPHVCVCVPCTSICSKIDNSPTFESPASPLHHYCRTFLRISELREF